MRWPWAAAAVAVLLAVSVGCPRAAHAQEQALGLDLVVTALSAVIGSDDELVVRLEVANDRAAAADGLSLTLDVLSRTTSRSDLRRALAPSVSRLLVGSVSRRVDPVAGGGVAPVELRLPAEEIGLGDADAGVYPLELQLHDAGETVETVRTSVVLIGATTGEPLRLALILPVTGPLGVLPDGRVRIDPLAGDLQDGGRLPALAATLADSRPIPLTLSVDALVLEEAAAATEGYTAVDAAGVVDVPAGAPPTQRAVAFLDDLRAVSARPQTEQVALPYGTADLVALARAELPSSIQRAIERGRSEVATATGEPALAEVLHPPLGLSGGVVEAARGVGTSVVVAGSDDVVPQEASTLSSSPVHHLTVGEGDPLTALVNDPWLADALVWPSTSADDDPGPALRAQRVLSELAALYFERPFAQEVRGAVVVPPLLWDPDPVTIGRVVDLLSATPLVRPVTVTTLLREVAPAPGSSAPQPDDDGDLLSAALLQDTAAAHQALESLSDVLAAPDEQLRAERLLWAAGSVHARGREPAARELVEAVRRATVQVLEAVEIVPGPQIILTGRREQIPVTVRNTGALPMRIRVAARSTAYGFPEGALSPPVTIPANETRQVDLTVETLRPGATAPVDVTATDAAGNRALAHGQVVVRSAATSPVALVITLGAGLFLAVWWIQDAQRRRSGTAAAAGSRRSGGAGVHSPTPHG